MSLRKRLLARAQAGRGDAGARQRRTVARAGDRCAEERVGAHELASGGATPERRAVVPRGRGASRDLRELERLVGGLRVGEPLDAVRELEAGGAALGRALERALGAAEEGERALGALAAHEHGAEAVG